MPRRRLRLSYSSDEEEEVEVEVENGREEEEDDEEEQRRRQQQHPIVGAAETLTLNSPNYKPAFLPLEENLPFDISDDDFVDVPENLSSTSPPAPIPDQPFQSSANTGPVNSGRSPSSPVDEFLQKLGLNLRREWLDSCISGLQSSVTGFSSFDVATKAKLCFEQFLFSDMNYSGGGVLPESVHSMHLVELAGPFVLQVDEIVNISCSLRERYQNAYSGIKRCLKLSMTDGVQRIFGMEYRPIKNLEVLAPAGLKVSISNVNIRRGLLVLVPEVLEVLGGLVEELDAAHQRLVQEVNKPPRGKRARTGVVPPLATRATLAAWPSNIIHGHGNNNNSISKDGTSFQRSDQVGSTLTMPDIDAIELLPKKDIDAIERTMEEFAASCIRQNTEPNLSSNAVFDVEETHMVAEVEHPLILTGDEEIPFTYLASFLTKWSAKKDDTQFIQGKIKCFLTGVKSFQYKRRTTFELQVFVDDGSLISEILIDHNVVQKGIGYSPEEVTAALASSDKKIVSDMKETMKQFQILLVNFEGIMLIERNNTFPLPVALEMNQGCSASDAWLLLRRLKTYKSAQTSERPNPNLINISP